MKPYLEDYIYMFEVYQKRINNKLDILKNKKQIANDTITFVQRTINELETILSSSGQGNTEQEQVNAEEKQKDTCTHLQNLMMHIEQLLDNTINDQNFEEIKKQYESSKNVQVIKLGKLLDAIYKKHLAFKNNINMFELKVERINEKLQILKNKNLIANDTITLVQHTINELGDILRSSGQGNTEQEQVNAEEKQKDTYFHLQNLMIHIQQLLDNKINNQNFEEIKKQYKSSKNTQVIKFGNRLDAIYKKHLAFKNNINMFELKVERINNKLEVLKSENQITNDTITLVKGTIRVLENIFHSLGQDKTKQANAEAEQKDTCFHIQNLMMHIQQLLDNKINDQDFENIKQQYENPKSDQVKMFGDLLDAIYKAVANDMNNTNSVDSAEVITDSQNKTSINQSSKIIADSSNQASSSQRSELNNILTKLDKSISQYKNTKDTNLINIANAAESVKSSILHALNHEFPGIEQKIALKALAATSMILDEPSPLRLRDYNEATKPFLRSKVPTKRKIGAAMCGLASVVCFGIAAGFAMALSPFSLVGVPLFGGLGTYFATKADKVVRECDNLKKTNKVIPKFGSFFQKINSDSGDKSGATPNNGKQEVDESVATPNNGKQEVDETPELSWFPM